MTKDKKSKPDFKKMIDDRNGKVGLNNPNIPKMKNPPPPPPLEEGDSNKQ
jgi:hypothetical protein